MRSSALKINVRALNRFLLVACILAAGAYFLTVNDLSTKGFVFKELKSKYNDMTIERQNMESSITALGSYQNLAPRIQGLRLVSVEAVRYISTEGSMVAIK